MAIATATPATATVVRDGDALMFTGVLDRAAVPALWKAASALVAGARRFELGAVESVDSAGVALLAELAELASRTDGAVLHGNPAGLASLRAAYRLAPGLDFSR